MVKDRRTPSEKMITLLARVVELSLVLYAREQPIMVTAPLTQTYNEHSRQQWRTTGKDARLVDRL
jgi:hypothetical protein